MDARRRGGIGGTVAPLCSRWRMFSSYIIFQPDLILTTLQQTLGWTCYVKVDNTTYTAMGSPGTAANNFTTQTQTEVRFTSKRIVVLSTDP